MRHAESLTPDYFEDMFRDNPDPWSFETSDYEKAKYARTVAALGSGRFNSGFEIGCANGVLTVQLAPLFDALLAVDVSKTAVGLAKARCRELDNVSVCEMNFPREAPAADTIDCVIMSEVAYYWDDSDLERAADWLRGLPKGACILLVHYILDTDYPQSGDAAVDKLANLLRNIVVVDHAERTARYRLDRWSIA